MPTEKPSSKPTDKRAEPIRDLPSRNVDPAKEKQVKGGSFKRTELDADPDGGGE